MKLKSSFLFCLCFLYINLSFGQTKVEISTHIRISIENLSAKNDSVYTNQVRNLEQNGYKFNKEGRWLNDQGEEMFISNTALPNPPNGFNDLHEKIKEKIRTNHVKSTQGSLVFNVTSKGEVVHIYSLNKGNPKLQKLISDLLLTSGKWSPGIESGPLTTATYRLTVWVE